MKINTLSIYRYSIPVLLVLLHAACTKTTVKDIDGNRYPTVVIGEQTWMAEDLKTTRLRDGSPIAEVELYEAWGSSDQPAYSWYNNEPESSPGFGALYNGYAVETGKLCPEGWHVPTDAEWMWIEQYVNFRHLFGGSLKAAGTRYWRAPNEGATNQSGFSALPGGYRNDFGTFNFRRAEGFWWSSTADDETMLYRNLSYKNDILFRSSAPRASGMSVRCLKD